MKWLIPTAILCSGCLPAYPVSSSSKDLSAQGSDAGDGGGVDAGKMPSGLLAKGILQSLQAERPPDGTAMPGGPNVYVDDSPEPAFTGICNDASGHFMLSIADSDVGAPHYLIIDGPASTSMGQPILRSWVAPRRVMDGGPSNNALLLHYFDNQGDMMGMQTVIARELAAQGDVASAATFGSNYSFAFGPIAAVSSTGFINYTNFAIQITDGGSALDNTQCGKPLTQCCVYYTTGSFGQFVNQSLPTFIDYGRQVARGTLAQNDYPGFVVVCPKVAGKMEGELEGEVTLRQTQPLSMLIASDGSGQPPQDPNDITCVGCGVTIPKVLNNGVHVEWWIILP